MGFEMKTKYLKPNERVVSLKPEKCSRQTRGGGYIMYVCEDNKNGNVILTPKLTVLADFLSSAEPIKQFRINQSSLWRSLSVGDGCGITAGWAKHRWRVQKLPLEGAVEVFSKLREQYANAVVLGSDRCVSTAVA